MFAIMRFKKLKTMSMVGSVDAHNSRKFNVENADQAKLKNNKYILGDENITTAVQEKLKNFKVRKNGVVAIEFLMTASPEYFRNDKNLYGDFDKKKVEEYEKSALKFLTKTFGKENIVSVITHLDEATPHLHAVITPITKDGRLAAADWVDGPYKLSKLQDDFASEFEHLGLQRGKKGSCAKHTDISKYYDDINNVFIPDLEKAVVDKPPTLLTSSAKSAWADSESQRIQTTQAPMLEPLANVASDRDREKAEKEAAEKEVIRLKNKLETDRVRDIDLHRVMSMCGYSRDPNDKNQYQTNLGRISIDIKDGKNRYFNQDTKEYGGGAIDLVKYLENTDFKGAVAFLGASADHAEVVASAQFKAASDASEAIKQTAPVPSAVEANWHRVREYLVKERKLKPEYIDWLKEKGKLYADQFSNAVFSYTSGAVELRGTRGIKFHGFRGKLNNGIFDLIRPEFQKVAIVESAIDALSLKELRPDISVVSVGGKGNALKRAKALTERGYDVIIATDNDKTDSLDNAAYEHSVSAYERLKPELKDWNEDLISIKTKKEQKLQKSSFSPVANFDQNESIKPV